MSREHELWAAAQLAPGEGIEDGVARIAAILRLAAPQPEPVAWRYQDARGHYRYRKYVAGFDVDYAILKPVPLYAAPAAPIDMVLHCPKCGVQHIDAPETDAAYQKHLSLGGFDDQWRNPPHRSHMCRPEGGGCGHIWRPADVPTNGVAAVQTKGKADSPIAAPVVREPLTARMPAHESSGDYPSIDGYREGYAEGWNDCLDAVRGIGGGGNG